MMRLQKQIRSFLHKTTAWTLVNFQAIIFSKCLGLKQTFLQINIRQIEREAQSRKLQMENLILSIILWVPFCLGNLKQKQCSECVQETRDGIYVDGINVGGNNFTQTRSYLSETWKAGNSHNTNGT